MTFQTTILSWYKEHKRDLPWRKTTDSYKILVSEVMLQQTQVERVVPIYTAFITQYPDLKALAKRELKDVLKAWKGLGYNRRAKYLWELSQNFLYRRKLPLTQEELQTLPGIGHYTAAAILAFSSNTDTVVIDTNIRRIHQRYFRDASPEKIANTLPKGKARDWNNALMDFGSAVCTKIPKCNECGLRRTCKAYKEKDFTVVVAKQAAFKDSNRYYRGRIVDALREKELRKEELLHLGQKTKVEKALASLEKDGLVQKKKNRFSL